MTETNNDITKKAKSISIRILAVLISFALVILVFWLITHQVIKGKQLGFDSTVFKLLQSYTNDGLTSFMKFFTFFGSRLFLLPAYTLLAAYYLIFKKSSKHSLGIAAVALSGAGILFIFKNIFKRDRPTEHLIENVTSFSYPSGHSFSAFTMCGILLYLFCTSHLKTSYKWICSIVVFLIAFLIAVSRIYLHVHYASDVIAGFCLSILWLTICFYLLKRINVITKRESPTI